MGRDSFMQSDPATRRVVFFMAADVSRVTRERELR